MVGWFRVASAGETGVIWFCSMGLSSSTAVLPGMGAMNGSYFHFQLSFLCSYFHFQLSSLKLNSVKISAFESQ